METKTRKQIHDDLLDLARHVGHCNAIPVFRRKLFKRRLVIMAAEVCEGNGCDPPGDPGEPPPPDDP